MEEYWKAVSDSGAPGVLTQYQLRKDCGVDQRGCLSYVSRKKGVKRREFDKDRQVRLGSSTDYFFNVTYHIYYALVHS